MGQEKVQWSAVWRLAARQHGVVARWQLLALGMNSDEIQYRLESRRLHRVWRGVYALGRPELSERGIWMAAVLACGSDAGLSHHSAGTLLEVHRDPAGEIHVSVPERRRLRRPGIIIHRRGTLALTRVDGIPVTSVVGTLIDLATRLTRAELEAAINAADKRDLIDPDRLRAALDSSKGPGVAILRDVLDRRTFTLTDSQLERRLLPIARSAGLPDPVTQRVVNGYEWTSTGPSSAWSSKRTACATTAPRLSRPATGCEIRHMPPRVSPHCASPTRRCSTSPGTCGRRCRPSPLELVVLDDPVDDVVLLGLF